VLIGCDFVGLKATRLGATKLATGGKATRLGATKLSTGADDFDFDDIPFEVRPSQ
jgi:uncharacterized protein YaaQ